MFNQREVICLCRIIYLIYQSPYQIMRRNEKMRKKLFILSPIIVLILTSGIMPFLPRAIPMHNSMWGEVDRWGSKYELFIIAGLSIVFNLLMELLYYINIKIRDYNVEGNKREKQKNFFYTCGIVFSFLIVLVIFSIVLEVKK